MRTLSSALFGVQGAATTRAAGQMEGRTDRPMQLLVEMQGRHKTDTWVVSLHT